MSSGFWIGTTQWSLFPRFSEQASCHGPVQWYKHFSPDLKELTVFPVPILLITSPELDDQCACSGSGSSLDNCLLRHEKKRSSQIMPKNIFHDDDVTDNILYCGLKFGPQYSSLNEIRTNFMITNDNQRTKISSLNLLYICMIWLWLCLQNFVLMKSLMTSTGLKINRNLNYHMSVNIWAIALMKYSKWRK